MNSYNLSDEVISQIAKLIQLAILTGTDVIDNLRTLRVTESDTDEGALVLTDEYKEIANSHVEKLLKELSEISEEKSSEED